LLTGALHSVFGSPGALQAVRLKDLLAAKQAQVERIQNQVHGLEEEQARLETSRVLQQREIRRVLGYAAPDEMIFDFSDAAKL
jgi:cell division protein FtsB